MSVIMKGLIEENNKLAGTIDGLHDELRAKAKEVRDLAHLVDTVFEGLNFHPESSLENKIRFGVESLQSELKDSEMKRENLKIAFRNNIENLRLREEGVSALQEQIDELNANLTAATNSINNVSEKYHLDGEGSFTEQVGRAIESAAPNVSFTTTCSHAPDGYGPLKKVLDDALSQAAFGKGAERHGNGKSFVEQPMITISQMLGNPDGMAYQVCKKVTEARGLPTRKARINELLGAIVYTAGMVVFEELRSEDDPSPLAVEICGALSSAIAAEVSSHLAKREYAKGGFVQQPCEEDTATLGISDEDLAQFIKASDDAAKKRIDMWGQGHSKTEE